jgi:hypothetical protein
VGAGSTLCSLAQWNRAWRRLSTERAAANLGIQVGEVERRQIERRALDDEGVFCDVDVRNFGLLDGRLYWRALGTALPARGGVAFRPPRCGLIPDRYRLPLLRPAAHAHSARSLFVSIPPG